VRGVEGGRADRQAEVFLVMLGFKCFPASALTSCCLFPCSVPAPIPALKPASIRAGLGKLLLSPASPHRCSAGLGSLGAARGARSWQEGAAGWHCRLCSHPCSRESFPGGSARRGEACWPLLAAVSALGPMCTGFLQLCSPTAGGWLASLGFGGCGALEVQLPAWRWERGGRCGNGAAVGAEQQLARRPGTVLGVFPAPRLCHSVPQQTQLCALQPSIWEQSGAGGFTGLSPTVVLGGDQRNTCKPLTTQGLFILQQPCAPHVVEAH